MMKMRKKASLVAATATVTFGSFAMADDYTFNKPYSASDAYVWDYSNPIFTNTTSGSPDLVAFPAPLPLNNAIFGAATLPNTPATPTVSTGAQQAIDVNNVSVGNLTVGTNQDPAAGNSSFTFVDYSGGGLTLNGDFTKTGTQGVVKFAFDFGGTLNLSAGNHTFKIQDSPGSASAEIRVEATVTGSGNLIVDNGDYEQWGQLHLQRDNTYTGQTILNKGMIVINASNALGATGASSNTVIQNAGALALGFGDGNPQLGAPNNGINVAEDITISRSVYTGDPAFDKYQFAIEVNGANGANTTSTFSGNLTVDSVDARVNANSSLVINKPILYSAAHTTDGILNLGGNTAGFVYLTADNSTGPMANLGVKISGGVELVVTNHNQIGGASAPITMNGGYIRLPAGSTNFGSHVVNFGTWNGGIDVPAGETFNITQNLTGPTATTGALGLRGTGTVNISGTNNLGGGSFWDGGVINVTGANTFGQLRTRSPIINISTGGSITTTSAFVSFGTDSAGTNGQPDKTVINITGDGKLIQTNNVDFNVSDNANTEGTINIGDNGELRTAGLMFIGKSAGAIGRINQTGGTINQNRNGNFGLVLGSRNGTGIYTMTGGTLNTTGEFYLGQGNGNASFGVGSFTASGSTTVINANNWFVLGREGAAGNFVLKDGATFNKAGGGSVEVDVGNQFNGQATPSSMTVDNATFNSQTGFFAVANSGGAQGSLEIKNGGKVIVSNGNIMIGNSGTGTVVVDNGTFTASGEFQIGNNASGVGTLTVRGNSVVSANNWMQVGRVGAAGTLNLEGGTITKSGGGNFYVGESANQTSVINMSGGALNVTGGEFWLGNAGSSKGTMNLSGGTLTVNNWLALGRNGTAQGVLNMTGGSIIKNVNGNSRLVIGSGATASGILTQSAGSIVSNLTSVGESGTGTADLSGGTADLGGLIVKDSGPAGTLKISGTAAVTATDVIMGASGAGTSLIQLAGGSFTANSITAGASTGSKTFDWTGGKLSVGSFNVGAGLNNAGTGTLAPGGDGGVGTVNITGDYVQAAGATFDFDLQNISAWDKAFATGSATIDGNLNVDILGSFDPAYADFLVFASSGPLTLGSSFALTGPDAASFTYKVVNGNSLVLTAVVPEPSSVAVLGLGATAMLRRKRRV